MKILIVDDSALLRTILKDFFSRTTDLVVVGEASNGKRAIELNSELSPDLIIMDIEMPVMDGLEATCMIMKTDPVPILIFSNEINAENSFRAVNNGAVEVLRKPRIGHLSDPEYRSRFIKKIRGLAKARVTKSAGLDCRPPEIPEGNHRFRLMVMGASTGGPMAVRTILSELPEDLPVSIVLVQHLEKGFERGYTQWLDDAAPLKVVLADEPGILFPGTVYVAPVDRHLVVRGERYLTTDGPRVLNQKPSVDVLFQSAAKAYRERVFAVLLTGMGRDGARGCSDILSAGGLTLVQDEKTSAIFGMPKAAIQAGAASLVLPLQEFSGTILKLLKNQ